MSQWLMTATAGRARPRGRGRKTALVGLVCGLALGAGFVAQPVDPLAKNAAIYLALGDSLAAGLRADGTEPRERSYVGLVGNRLRSQGSVPVSVAVANLACSGETSVTMMAGGTCRYVSGGQFRQVRRLLATAGDRVRWVTIGIGINDVSHCLRREGRDDACVARALSILRANLDSAVVTIRAGAPAAQVVLVNYFDPLVAFEFIEMGWGSIPTDGPVVIAQLNAVIAQVAHAHGLAVADMAGAFETGDRTLVDTPPYGPLPVEVARICEWTAVCDSPTRDIHPNDAGHQVTADAVWRALTLP